MSAGCDYRGNIAYCDVTIEDYNRSQLFKQNIFLISISMYICVTFYITSSCWYYYYCSYEDIKVRVLGDVLCREFKILFRAINNKGLIFVSNLRIMRVSTGT
jgi:hypothetical protein